MELLEFIAKDCHKQMNYLILGFSGIPEHPKHSKRSKELFDLLDPQEFLNIQESPNNPKTSKELSGVLNYLNFQEFQKIKCRNNQKQCLEEGFLTNCGPAGMLSMTNLHVDLLIFLLGDFPRRSLTKSQIPT